jgi:hypothetical protein
VGLAGLSQSRLLQPQSGERPAGFETFPDEPWGLRTHPKITTHQVGAGEGLEKAGEVFHFSREMRQENWTTVRNLPMWALQKIARGGEIPSDG